MNHTPTPLTFPLTTAETTIVKDGVELRAIYSHEHDYYDETAGAISGADLVGFFVESDLQHADRIASKYLPSDFENVRLPAALAKAEGK